MRKSRALVASVGLMLAVPAQAGVYTDDLGKCIVEKTSEADRVALIQWLFGVLSASPKVAAQSKVTPAERNRSNQVTGKLFERLLTVDCRAKTVTALKYDGAGAIQEAFGLLGKVAMADMTREPEVAAEFGKLNQHIDMAKMAAMLAEAGITPTKPGASK